METTINGVRYAVNAALDAAFPDIPVSGEEIKQELKPPRFFCAFTGARAYTGVRPPVPS